MSYEDFRIETSLKSNHPCTHTCKKPFFRERPRTPLLRCARPGCYARLGLLRRACELDCRSRGVIENPFFQIFTSVGLFLSVFLEAPRRADKLVLFSVGPMLDGLWKSGSFSDGEVPAGPPPAVGPILTHSLLNEALAMTRDEQPGLYRRVLRTKQKE